VLEALVDRQDHELAGAAERSVVEQSAQIRQHARLLVRVSGQDLVDGFTHRFFSRWLPNDAF
jgi:hypothetical protein